MFDTNMNSMEFQIAPNEGITNKPLNTSADINKEVPRRVSDNSTNSEDSNSNNMFTKVRFLIVLFSLIDDFCITLSNIPSICCNENQFAFPFKLHSILENSEASGQESIISWLPSGKAFKIHKPKEFADAIMPQYFNQTKYRSFQRQLYIYGFDRIKDKQSEDYGAYYHELFIRGASDLCLDMQRKKIKGTGLSNEERRKKANKLREENAKPKPTKVTSQSLFDTDRLTTNSQSLYTTLGMNNPLADQLQERVQKMKRPEGWDSASAAAVLKSALQVQEFANRQDRMNLHSLSSNNGTMPDFSIRQVGGRRCSLGFVRTTSGAGRRGSLLFDGDEVIFGDKKFHFTDNY